MKTKEKRVKNPTWETQVISNTVWLACQADLFTNFTRLLLIKIHTMLTDTSNNTHLSHCPAGVDSATPQCLLYLLVDLWQTTHSTRHVWLQIGSQLTMFIRNNNYECTTYVHVLSGLVDRWQTLLHTQLTAAGGHEMMYGRHLDSMSYQKPNSVNWCVFT